MKKLLILPLFILLTACVTYYYPETALEDGIYYAEDDPSYVVYSGAYAGAVYYPWLSLDYFYLGYYPSRYYGYYGYFSPWYAGHYRYPYYHPGSRSYYGYCTDYGGCQRANKKSRRGSRQNRYAGNEHGITTPGSRNRMSASRSQKSRSTPSSSGHRRSNTSSSSVQQHRE